MGFKQQNSSSMVIVYWIFMAFNQQQMVIVHGISMVVWDLMGCSWEFNHPLKQTSSLSTSKQVVVEWQSKRISSSNRHFVWKWHKTGWKWQS
jgi:hypothetical protein